MTDENIELYEEEATLQERITAYLSLGGLFNPEMANHDAVRDLIIDLREALRGSISERETLTAELNDKERHRCQKCGQMGMLSPTVVLDLKAEVKEANTLLDAAISDWNEALKAVARLTTENTEAIRSRDAEWERAKVARAEAATLRDEIDEMKKALTAAADTIEKQNQQHDTAADRHRLDTQLLGQAFGDVGELREQVRRLTRDKAAVEEIANMASATAARLNSQLIDAKAFREQAIQDIEALATSKT